MLCCFQLRFGCVPCEEENEARDDDDCLSHDDVHGVEHVGPVFRDVEKPCDSEDIDHVKDERAERDAGQLPADPAPVRRQSSNDNNDAVYTLAAEYYLERVLSCEERVAFCNTMLGWRESVYDECTDTYMEHVYEHRSSYISDEIVYYLSGEEVSDKKNKEENAIAIFAHKLTCPFQQFFYDIHFPLFSCL